VYVVRYPVSSLGIACAYGLLVFLAIGESRRESLTIDAPQRKWLLWSLAALLILLPGVLISLSPVRQADVYPGVGYSPVYISYFGVALAAVTGIGAMVARGGRHLVLWAAMIALLCAGIGVTNFQNNRLVLEVLNRAWLYPREVVTEAMDRGLLSQLPDGATLIVEPDRSWDVPEFYFLYSGKRLKAVDVASGVPASSLPGRSRPSTTGAGVTEHQFEKRDAVYYLAYGALSRGVGSAQLAQVVSLKETDGRVIAMQLIPLAEFEVNRPPKTGELVMRGVDRYVRPKYLSAEMVGFRADDLKLVGSGPGWSLRAGSALDPQSASGRDIGIVRQK
jgi:hypothetical protein